HQKALAVPLAYALELDHLIAEPLGDGDEDLLRFVALLVLVARKLLEARDAALALRLSALRPRTHPLELALERFLACRFRGFFLFQTLRLLVEPRTVVALPRNPAAAVE